MTSLEFELLAQEFEKKLVFKRPFLQGPEDPLDFHSAQSSLILGAPNHGKSRLLMRLLARYREESEAQAIDAFGARNDSESTNHLLNPKTKDSTLCIVGNEVETNGLPHVMKISDFELEKCKRNDYPVIITDRAFFGPKRSRDKKVWDGRYYAALAKIFEECENRENTGYLIAFALREVGNVAFSINKAGVSWDQQQAQEQFRVMHSQRYHSRIAMIMDTQRFTDSAASIRSIADSIFLKGLGRMPMPDELKYLWKPHLFGDDPYHGWWNPRHYMIRNCKKDEFIYLGPTNGVATGWFADIPWHIKKGRSPLIQLGIKIELKKEDKKAESQEPSEERTDFAMPTPNEQHEKMIELHLQGDSYKDIANRFENGDAWIDGPYKGVRIKTTWQKVAYHLTNKCACEAASANS